MLRSRAVASADGSPPRPSRPTEPRRSLLMRMAVTCCPTMYLAPIWSLIAANYVCHVLLREESWNAPTVVAGHVLVALQLASYFQCTLTHPGTPPDAWRTAAEAGAVPAARHRLGAIVPPRARYLRKLDAVLLHFDHHCWWLDTPIGRLNRKFFLLFVGWSAALSGFACALSCVDLLAMLPLLGEALADSHSHMMHARRTGRRAGDARFDPDDIVGEMTELLSMTSAAPLGLALVAISRLSRAQLARAALLWATAAANGVACVLLGVFGGMHARWVLRNQTTLHPFGEAEFNVGWLANVRQVFGRRPLLWPLPVWWGDAPAGDGLSWPRREGAAPLASARLLSEVQAGDEDDFTHLHSDHLE